MGGNKDIMAALQQGKQPLQTDNQPSVVKELKTLATRPGFLTWKDDDEPVFKIKGKAKITGQGFDLDAALQQKQAAGSQKQGPSTPEFPNVKPLVVEADKEDDDDVADKSGLGRIDFNNLWDTVPLAAAFFFGIGVGWWYWGRNRF
jgi:hypothetical protein